MTNEVQTQNTLAQDLKNSLKIGVYSGICIYAMLSAYEALDTEAERRQALAMMQKGLGLGKHILEFYAYEVLPNTVVSTIVNKVLQKVPGNGNLQVLSQIGLTYHIKNMLTNVAPASAQNIFNNILFKQAYKFCTNTLHGAAQLILPSRLAEKFNWLKTSQQNVANKLAVVMMYLNPLVARPALCPNDGSNNAVTEYCENRTAGLPSLLGNVALQETTQAIPQDYQSYWSQLGSTCSSVASSCWTTVSSTAALCWFNRSSSNQNRQITNPENVSAPEQSNGITAHTESSARPVPLPQ